MTPKQAMKILKKEGTIVTEQEAEIILDFLYKIAEISVNTIMKSLDKSEVEFASGRGSSSNTSEKTTHNS